MKPFQTFWEGGVSWRQRYGAPKNRMQLFWYVLHDQFFSLLPINLIYAAFWLPTILWTIVHILLLLKTMETGADLDAMQYINRFFWGLLPCMLIIGPARAGLAQVMRNWAAEEYISAIPVFIDGFKENWKQALIISALAGVFPVAAWYGLLTSIHSGTSYMITILIVACVLYGFFFLAQQILFPSIVTYELPLRVHIKNAFILTVLRLPSALLICAASMGIVILYIVIVAIRPDWVYAALIVPVLYYFFVGFSVTELIRASYYRSLRAKYFEQETVPKFGD